MSELDFARQRLMGQRRWENDDEISAHDDPRFGH